VRWDTQLAFLFEQLRELAGRAFARFSGKSSTTRQLAGRRHLWMFLLARLHTLVSPRNFMAR
jgi:hypothetical protein